jgi:hypothetical protein
MQLLTAQVALARGAHILMYTVRYAIAPRCRHLLQTSVNIDAV